MNYQSCVQTISCPDKGNKGLDILILTPDLQESLGYLVKHNTSLWHGTYTGGDKD